MIGIEFSKYAEIVLESTSFGISEIYNIKSKNNEKIGSIKLFSAQKYWEGFSILDNQNNIIAKVEGQELNQSKQAIAKIFDSDNKLLATMITQKSAGNFFSGQSKATVIDENNKELFEITANYVSGRKFGKSLNDLEFTKDGQKIVEFKTSFWTSKNHIKLLAEIDMRIVITSFVQFYSDAARVAGLKLF